MDLLSAAQRPFFYDSVNQTAFKDTVDRRHITKRTACAAHHVVDALADQALTGIGKASGSLHVAVNHAADAAIHTANRVAQVPAHMRQTRIKFANAALAPVKARPFVTLGSAIAIGYLLGRMVRR
jgi:ElaB/YqjD/DUF883 family membrane-anchored ribosome-binding protein